MARVTIEALHVSSDERGLVAEPLGAELLAVQKNVHVAVTEPGAIRGNHYHEHSTEIAVVIGPGLVRIRDDGEVRDIQIPTGEARRFVIPAGVSHAFQNTGSKPMLIVAFSTAVFDPLRPDVIRDILIAGSGNADRVKE